MAIMEGKWNCSHCGKKRIKGRLNKCPDCGDIRSSVLDSEERIYLDDETPVTDAEGLAIANSGPGWTCGSCGEENRGDKSACANCTKPRDADDFAHATTTYADADNLDGDELSSPEQVERDRTQQVLDSAMDPQLVLDNRPASRPNRTLDISHLPRGDEDSSAKKPPRSHNASAFGGFIGEHLRKLVLALIAIVAVVAVIFGGRFIYVNFFATETVPVTVTSTYWERSVEVEELRTLTLEDWWDKLPGDAIQVSHLQKQRGTEEEYDYTDTRTSKETSRVSVGESTEEYECGSKTVDLGNGFFDKKTKYCDREVTEYDDVVTTKTYTTDIYKDVPVYDDWVTYRVNRWVTASYTTASGAANPYWPRPIISGINQKAGDSRQEIYRVTVTDAQGRTSTHQTSDFNSWNQLHVGTNITGEQNKQGSMLSVNWP